MYREVQHTDPCGCVFDNGQWFPCQDHMNAAEHGYDFGPGDRMRDDDMDYYVEAINEFGEVTVLTNDGAGHTVANGKRLEMIERATESRLSV